MSPKSLLSSSSFEPKRKADVNIRLSEFEIPPMQDILLVGKKAPIGPKAIRLMVDAVSPDQYEIIQLDNDIFEAAVVKKSLLKLLPKEKLLSVILEEGARVATEKTVVKAQVNVIIHVGRVVDL